MLGSIGLSGETQLSRSSSQCELSARGSVEVRVGFSALGFRSQPTSAIHHAVLQAVMAPKPSEDESRAHSPKPKEHQTFTLTDAGQAILRDRIQNQDSTVTSMLRHADSQLHPAAAPPSPRQLAVGPYSPRIQQPSTGTATVSLQPYTHVQPILVSGAVGLGQAGKQPEAVERYTPSPAPPLRALPQPGQTATNQNTAGPQLAAETLTQVATAAAVAAAQSVKHDADSELSQVLKAVLLQQSRIGIANSALANAVGPGFLAMKGHEKSIGPRVAGHRLTETAPHAIPPPHSATPVVHFLSADNTHVDSSPCQLFQDRSSLPLLDTSADCGRRFRCI